MPRFVVLLRGVNVGKGNRLPMAEFRALLEKQGFTDVRTLLNSGNAVVRSPDRSAAKHAKIVHAALEDDLGLSVPVLVKSSADFSAAVSGLSPAPPKEEHSRVLVVFGQDASAVRELSSLVPLARPPERFVIGRRAAYSYCPDGVLKSNVGKALLGKVGRSVTTRNWATVLKLNALLQAST